MMQFYFPIQIVKEMVYKNTNLKALEILKIDDSSFENRYGVQIS